MDCRGCGQRRCYAEYSMTWGHTLVAGDMSVSRREYDFVVNQGGTADINCLSIKAYVQQIFVLDKAFALSRFFLCKIFKEDGKNE